MQLHKRRLSISLTKSNITSKELLKGEKAGNTTKIEDGTSCSILSVTMFAFSVIAKLLAQQLFWSSGVEGGDEEDISSVVTLSKG